MNPQLSNSTACDEERLERTIMFVPSAESSLKEMLFLAERLTSRKRFQASFVIRTPIRQRWLDDVRRQGHELIVMPQAQQATSSPIVLESSAAQRTSWRKRIRGLPKRFLRGLGRWLPADSVSKYVRARRRFRSDRQQAARLLDAVKPRLIVTPSDRTIGLETALLAEARESGIPSLVIPWCLWTPRSEIYARAERPACEESVNMSRFVNRWVANRLPNQVISSGARSYLFAPGETILAAQNVGILPPRPFAYFGGCGLATRVAVESEALLEMCLARGVEQRAVRLTGRAFTDVVVAHTKNARAHRSELCHQLGLRPHWPIVLCAVPNTAEQDLCSWHQHSEDTRRLFALLHSVGNLNVVLNLHPKSDPETYRTLASEYRFVIAAQHSIEDLIPACDLFVSTFSSTIIMAIGSHKPVVNLDLFGANDDAFANCNGVVTVRRWPDAVEAFQRLMNDPDHYRQLVEAQKTAAPRWGLFDGRCTDRLLAEMNALTQEDATARFKAA